MINKHRSSWKGKPYGNNYYWNCAGFNSITAHPVFFSTRPIFGCFAFFRFLPSVKSYYKALKAIEKLRNLNYTVLTPNTGRFKGKAALSSKDEGFRELVMLLRKYGYFRNVEVVEELVMHEIKGGQYWEPHIIWLDSKIEGEYRMEIASAEYTPAIQILREMADQFVRGKIETYIAIAAVLLFLLTIGFIIYSSLATGQITQ